METNNNVTEADSRENAQKKKIWDGMPAMNWLWIGLFLSLVFSIVFAALYDVFQSRGAAYAENPVESYDNIYWLYSNNEILYYDLFNVLNHSNNSYSDVYYPQNELESEDGISTEELYDIQQSVQERLESHYQYLENQFMDLNFVYDYFVRDTETGAFVTNTASKDGFLPQDYYFYLTFQYDEHGNVTIGEDVRGDNRDRIRKNAVEITRAGKLSSDGAVNYSDAFYSDAYYEYLMNYTTARMPVNCEITYGITPAMWLQMQDGSNTRNTRYNLWWSTWNAYEYGGCGQIYDIFLLAAMLLGLFLPWVGKNEPWKRWKLLSLPPEILITIGIVLFGMGTVVVSIAVNVNSGQTAGSIASFFDIPLSGGYFLAYTINIMILTALFLTAWLLGISARAVKSRRPSRYIREKSLIYRFFPYIRQKLSNGYQALLHFDVTRNANKTIIKLVLVNAVILLVISIFWFGGMALTVAYSIVLYFILKKYVSDLQKKYGVLLSATNEIAHGNLNVSITEDLGVFEPFKPQIIRIQHGFKNAVEEEVKSQRMKTELITNVSHDLKTPLTAIITYIDLLKDENLDEERRREYLETLENKSLRLKALIEDLFEVSKATSKNVTLNIMDVDIMNLVKQVELEMSDKLKEANLDVRMNLSDTKTILPLDSQKTYRIYENLFGNIAKYALPGTRVYVNGARIDNMEYGHSEVVITLKNITEQEIKSNPEELTDRFVRGDSSRNTEGSGLGLSIAKSFMELQNGKLDIDIDGDLFKVTTTWTIPITTD